MMEIAMEPSCRAVLSVCLLWSGFMVENSPAQTRTGGPTWPHPFPCRIHEGAQGDLFVMTLGPVQTPLADGVFDPASDQVRLTNGEAITSYYRDSLRIAFFQPIDKSRFPLPPSGWCSWYYYYQELNEKEMRDNAHWVAKNLKDFGGDYVQIDDGWQGVGHGSKDNRDWTTIDKRFPHGMDGLASYIKKLGLKPGIWLAPHGQSNPKVVEQNRGAFLLKPDGTSLSETWEGKFLLDPTSPEAHSYLRKLFPALTSWGYDYFKIDGQPIVLQEFKKLRSLMRQPPNDVAAVYRETLESIRSAIGADRYLLGCWGTPVEGVGIMNGSRTGGDIVLGWNGFKVALDATMKFYYLHNIAWYCDPDVMLLRSPLTVDQARAWATLQGLTGQALMASDRMMDLSSERVEIMKRVYPATDIRPLDLFPSHTNKHIWDLKIAHLGRNYDVVGVFNFGEHTTKHLLLRWKDLGLPPGVQVHVFDYWNQEYLGCWEAGIHVEVAPTSCRVLTLLPTDQSIQLISTNRHITQGWVDLVALSFDERSLTFRGNSHVVANDPYEIRFVFPRGSNFAAKSASAERVGASVMNHQGWATVRFTSPKTTTVKWTVSFERAPLYSFPVKKPGNVTVEPVGIDGVDLRWSPQYYSNAGYLVSLDGILMGYTPVPTFPLRNLDPGKTSVAAVSSVWEDGTRSSDTAVLKFSLAPLIQATTYLSSLEPVQATCGWGTLEMDKAVTGNPITIHGARFARGIGTHANSVIEYRLHGLFATLNGEVGVDDGNGSDKGSVDFSVFGDGKELWRSGVLTKGDALRAFQVNIEGVRQLILHAGDGGDGIDYDHADWATMRVEMRNKSGDQ